MVFGLKWNSFNLIYHILNKSFEIDDISNIFSILTYRCNKNKKVDKKKFYEFST